MVGLEPSKAGCPGGGAVTATFATLLFVPLAAWALRRPRRLVLLLAASVGFSGTAVLNFPGLAFGFQPYHLFGSLLMGRAAVAAVTAAPASPSRRPPWPLAAFVVLVLFAVVSYVTSRGATGGADTKVLVAQLFHLGFGVGVAWAISVQVQTWAVVDGAVRAFEIGAVTIALWGFGQFLCDRAGVTYPDFIFNNSVGRYASNFASTIGPLGVVRVGSVATEPSFLARTLVMALALAGVRRAWAHPTQRRHRLAICVVLVGGVLVSTSTTGVIGLATLAILALVRGRSVRARRIVAVAFGVLVILLALSPALGAGLQEMTFNKSTSGSFEQRQAATEQARDQFLGHPVLGVGLGAQTANDLVYKIGSNLGVVGLLCYSVAVAGLFSLGRGLRAGSSQRGALLGLKLALLLSLVLDAVAGWSYTYGDFWVISGLLLAAGSCERRQSSSLVQGGTDSAAVASSRSARADEPLASVIGPPATRYG